MDLGVMLSQWSPGQDAAGGDERERLLDAARAEFVAHGFRRAAVADIAKRAKVSRQTLNRHCGDKDDMMSAVVTREVLQFFARLMQVIDQGSKVEDQVVELFVVGVRECRVNPLVEALKAYDAEAMSTNLLGTENGNYQLVLSALAARLMADSYPEPGARQAAELIMRITATILLAPSNTLNTETDESARQFARTYFIPILAAARVVS